MKHQWLWPMVEKYVAPSIEGSPERSINVPLLCELVGVVARVLPS